MRPCQLSRSPPRLAERPQNFSILVEFDNSVVPAVHHPDVLIASDTQPVRISDPLPFLQKLSICVEDFDPSIFAVSDIDAIFLVHHNAVRQIEFTGAVPVLSPALNEVSVAVKLHHPRIPVAVGNVN